MLENKRTDREMMQIILQTAEEDKRIRAVYMNGSRANTMVPTDSFQDFDIVYVVTEIASFLQERSWLLPFGDPVIVQEPDDKNLAKLFPEEETREDAYAFLMQFMDGNRIDLTLQSIEKAKREYGTDPLTIPLLDKDNNLKELPRPSDDSYHVKQPVEGEYLGCCNEFWWVSAYVAKGLHRREILYALDHLNSYVRPMLLKMLSWQVGFLTDFSISVGKNEKYLERYLPKKQWEDLMKTYTRAEYEEIWNALEKMGRLFEESAKVVAGAAGFRSQVNDPVSLWYDRSGEAERMKSYLLAVRKLEQPNGFRLVGLDLDGTLLNDKKEITEQTKQAITACISKGVFVVPATGRPENGLPECLMEMEGITYALTANGARVINVKTGEEVYTDFMKKEAVFFILDETEKWDLSAEIYSNGCVYVEEARYKKQLDTVYFGEMREYIRKTRKPVSNLRKWIQDLPYGIEKINLVCEDDALREKLWKCFDKREDLTLTNSMEHNMECNHVSANKGSALLALGKILGIGQEQIMACGDSGNDSEMLRRVGFGVAMGNAEPSIKAVANYITASNEEDGVAKALEKFVIE